jgi:hypothetical protein
MLKEIEETILTKISANMLRLTMASNFLGSQKKIYQVISSPSVERLEVTGPCSLQLQPRMSRLQAVATSPCSRPAPRRPGRRHPLLLPAEPAGGRRCTGAPLQRGREALTVRALWAQSFNDVALPMQTNGLTFTKWMIKVKKAFFEDYLLQGSMMDGKAWGRARWSSRAMPESLVKIASSLNIDSKPR